LALSRLLLVVAGVAVLAAVGGWQRPLVFGLAGVAATTARAVAVPGGIPRLRVVAVGGLLTASAVAWLWIDWRLLAVVGLSSAAVLYPALQMVQRRGDEDTGSARYGRLARGLVIGAAVALTGLAALGVYERNQASFALRYGQLVAVTVGPGCRVGMSEGELCPDATWTIDGTSYHGKLFVGLRELARSGTEAYAYPGENRAYTAWHHSADTDGMEVVGFVPPWLAIAGLVMGVVVALPARVRNRVRGLGRVD
jgi:hypothetical protein